MIKNESQQKPSFTSSEQTDDSGRSDAILALGRKLVEELGLEQSVDTLGRWMAHYVADLICRFENQTGDEKQLIGKNCFDTILTLWKHLAEVPTGRSPFEDLEPVVRAIESLDPDDNARRYFRLVPPPQRQEVEESEADWYLELVSDLDYSAKILIGYFLGEAARTAVNQSEEWVKLAKAAGAADTAPEIVIRLISKNADLGNEPDPNAEVRQQLRDRIGRLEAFIKLAETVSGDLKTRLDALPPFREGDDLVDVDHPFDL